MSRELKEAKTAHANCSGRFIELQHEIDTLRQDGAHHNQTIQHLRDRYELLEARLARETDNSARAREEGNRMKEEVTRLQVENHKTSRALEQALKDVQVQVERVKLFQGYIEQYKHKVFTQSTISSVAHDSQCNLEKKKRKAIENANRQLLPREDDSLMVVDPNAPDMLHQDGPDFGWLDKACEVKGDQLIVPGDDDFEFERESEDEVQLSDPGIKGKQRVSWRSFTRDNKQYLLHIQEDSKAPGPSLRYSDWNLGLKTLGRPSSGATRNQRHGSRQAGASKIVKVKIPAGGGTRKPVEGPLAIDSRGHIKGTVVLGSRQKFNSKN